MKQIRTLGIVGTGLIGTSIALAVRQRRVADSVTGVDVDPAAAEEARSRGALDRAGTSYTLLQEADLVVVAVPPAAVVDAMLEVAQIVRPGTVLTDVASIKGPIVSALEARLPHPARFVGGHPMAGSEGQGPAAADPALLAGRPFIVTPTARSDADAVEAVSALARGIGMRPVVLDAAAHDRLAAEISHLPYVLAVGAVNAASDGARPLAGPAFASLRRLAASPPELWTQICVANRAAIRTALEGLRVELDRFEGALDRESAMRELLSQTQRRALESRQ